MEELVYRVRVDSGDPSTDRSYLQQLRDTFRMITEGLVNFGFTDDESISFSDINTIPDREDS